MRWSIRLGTVRGVAVEVHLLFGVLIAWTVWRALDLPLLRQLLYAPASLLNDANSRWLLGHAVLMSAGQVLLNLGVLGLFFGSVLIHEIAHSLQALALGIPVRRILLLPVGGLAELMRPPERPRDELRVVLAGPASNLGLALIGGSLAAIFWLAQPVWQTPAGLQRLLLDLALANASLALLNLVPFFPLDGGRILRAALAGLLPRQVATAIVSGLSLAGGLGLLAWAVLGNRLDLSIRLALGLMSVTSLASAGHEQQVEASRQSLGRIRVAQALRQPTWTLTPDDALTPELLGAFFRRPAVPVIAGDRLVGLVVRDDLLAALKQPAPGAVAQVMRTGYARLTLEQDLWQAYQVFASAGVSVLPVVDGDSLHGMLNLADLHAARQFPAEPPPVQAPVFISGGNPAL